MCGDAANMAAEVSVAVAGIIAENRGISMAEGKEFVRKMRSENRYQVR